ncbi:asparagine synthase (glutamine-hydrolyzing) [Rhizobium rhizogenes]|uniref:asparagine synthase (glutamine-hydrolyzing) n=1 Tax=Rhizobium rhizogenes (strain K84 / ATCC BAA-868) TaxID=311403 RepID=B9JPU2_RHIR8|nr:asparagine synthase (glutamine-hydrolyzing) [Rhizobium rhizogenes K84]NTG77918.1 asparagine synthase (glutamine-hydrolyzing) [Rhizobium rhizogenes]
MCGIAGVASRQAHTLLRPEVVRMALHRLGHRGPDGTETYHCAQGVFGAVRLAMNGLESAAVALKENGGKLSLFYNGEIYNQRELRAELAEHGVRFSTTNDGEIILHLYKLAGLAMLDRLDGMFSFALVDEDKGETIIARDRFGIKPLYYHYDDSHGQLFFGSELKVIRCLTERAPEIDRVSVASYLHLRFIPAPFSIYQNIRKLEPGCYLRLNREGLRREKYVLASRDRVDARRTQQSLSGELDDRLRDAVAEMLHCETEIGSFLSGGIDSTLVVQHATRLNAGHKAFSVGYKQATIADETEQAKKSALALGTDHRVTLMSSDDCLTQQLKQSSWYLDEPVLSTVSLPTFELSRFSRQFVKGVLAGDGSDEIFMGYNYLYDLRHELGEHQLLERYIAKIGWLRPAIGSQVAKEYFAFDPFDTVLLPSDDPWEAIRSFEVNYRLPDYHLHRVDRLSMAHSLEVRIPYLHKSIYDFAFSFSARDLIEKFPRKAILRGISAGGAIDHLLQKKKMPFTSPYADWLHGPLKEYAEYLFFQSTVGESLGIDLTQLGRVVNLSELSNHLNSTEIWGFFSLFNWAQVTDESTPSFGLRHG